MYSTNELLSKVLPLLANYPVRMAAIFGSYARNEQNADSDLDILIDFSEPIGLGYGSLHLDLQEAVPVAVGLLTVSGLNEQPYSFRESVLRDIEVFYEK